MGSELTVSVITIFLNAAKYLPEAIDSVLAQTYGDWELLLVDDGSSDGSTAIARRYVEQHPGRMRYLEHEGHANRGMSASRNLGIKNARGKYLAFLDADDVWLPDKLAEQVGLLEAHPEAAMVYGPTQWWYSWTGDPQDQGRDFVHPLGVQSETLIEPPHLLAYFLRHEAATPCNCSVLIRREAVARARGFEESFRGLFEDQAFFAKVCLRERIFVSGEWSCRYRQHPKSSCAVAETAGQHRPARQAFLEWLAGYMAGQGVADDHVWRPLRRELRPYRHPLVYGAFARLRGLLRLALRRRAPGMGHALTRARAALPHALLQLYRLPLMRNLRCLGLRRLRPFGEGKQLGTPIVRYYWAHFLHRQRSAIRGRCLEIGTTATVRQYGGQAVTQADALDLAAHSDEVTVVADLSRADDVPADTYDCFVNQFTMHVVYDVEAALYHSLRLLKPGGVLLVNFPCVDYYFARGLDMGTGAPLFLHWWFTPIQVENLLRRAGLAEGDYALTVYGNLFARVAYQMNMPAEELTRSELAYVDPGHPLLICVRAVKPAGWQCRKPEYREPWLPSVAPARWNAQAGHYARSDS